MLLAAIGLFIGAAAWGQEQIHFLSDEERMKSQEAIKNGDAFMEMKQYQQAIEEYKKASNAKSKIGNAYFKLKQYTEAGEAYLEGGNQIKAGEAFYLAGDLRRSAKVYDAGWSYGDSLYGACDLKRDKPLRHADGLFRTGEPDKAAKLFYSTYGGSNPSSLKRAVGAVRSIFPNPYIGCETAQDFAAVDQAQSLRSINQQLMINNAMP
jgi:tetratricopeptide (TPR) repeat protein